MMLREASKAGVEGEYALRIVSSRKMTTPFTPAWLKTETYVCLPLLQSYMSDLH